MPPPAAVAPPHRSDDDGDGGEGSPCRVDTAPPMAHPVAAILLLVACLHPLGRATSHPAPAPAPARPTTGHGTRWAVLVAGSSGYRNYRHQADICHAYQILKRGGVKDENIVVFMADDIAHNDENPRPGVIINRPTGDDVYAGVPKDYTGDQVTVNNFLAVLLGNQSALTGGSGKVLRGGPDDLVFVFYVDHGSPGSVEMPTGPDLYADDLVKTLQRMHDSKSYGSLVFYLEACESASMFEGLLPEDIRVYATTASNAEESSYATYCPEDKPPDASPRGYGVCLGDLYSVSWMEDSDEHDLRLRTLRQQYETVRNRASVNKTYKHGSHVKQYGDQKLGEQLLSKYFGPAAKLRSRPDTFITTGRPAASGGVNQRDAHLRYFWNKFITSKEGSPERADARKQLLDVISHQSHVDSSMEDVGSILFGRGKSRAILEAVRSPGLPLVDDWDCLRKMVRSFETYCGSLGRNGRKHTRAMANICNAGIGEEEMAAASSQACKEFPSNPRSSLRNGFSA